MAHLHNLVALTLRPKNTKATNLLTYLLTYFAALIDKKVIGGLFRFFKFEPHTLSSLIY